MELKEIKCPNCGAALNVENDEKTVKCSYCGTSFPAEETQAADNADDAEAKDGEKPEEEEKQKSFLKEALDFCLPIIIALIVAMLLKSFVFANAVVPTGSMLDTIQLGDRVIASRLEYKFNEPERYDIIIFRFPDAVDAGDNKTFFVKRVIGLPGETVSIENGVVYVTGKDGKTIQLEDDFIKEPMNGSFGPYEVPEDSYFMLGDNRNHSEDSRYWNNKFVHKDLIIGKVKFRYYPSIGKVE
ncbi:MAG: signal peptidase I [Eubacterium sp.]|nr:signal peptidase I [Eubacterium sp.]